MRLAGGQELAVVALTDHDTTAGLAEAAAALPAGLTLVPGAEISCGTVVADGRDGRGPRAAAGRWVSLHLLAYLFDPAEPAFAAARAGVRAARLGRAERMVELLRSDGHPVEWERVRGFADGVVGRPHVAEALVEVGLVPTVGHAFTPDWIGTRGRYWVGKDEPDVLEAIRLVRGAGGVAVLAHPYASKRGDVVGAEAIRAMAAAGLAGLEVDHPDHDQGQRTRLRALAAELDLVVTGSSDFHGPSKPQGLGAETTAPAAYEALVAGASGAAPLRG